MKISQMKKDELFEGFSLIKSAEVRQTRAGKDYIAFTFQDDTGEIEGKLWDAQPHNVAEFTAGKVVHMQGRREVYNNTNNLLDLSLSDENRELVENFVSIMDAPFKERWRRLRKYGYRKNRAFHTFVFSTLILTKFAYKR